MIRNPYYFLYIPILVTEVMFLLTLNPKNPKPQNPILVTEVKFLVTRTQLKAWGLGFFAASRAPRGLRGLRFQAERDTVGGINPALL